jgi:hypothetical protein
LLKDVPHHNKSSRQQNPHAWHLDVLPSCS